MKKVKVISLVPYRVGLIIPDRHFVRNFTEEGQIVLVDEEILKEGMYERGVRNLFEKGILKIVENDDLKVELDLATETEKNGKKVIEDNFLVLNKTQMITLLKIKPYSEFVETVEKMSASQIDLLVNLAVENKITDYDKCKFIKEKTGKDILSIIRLNEE